MILSGTEEEEAAIKRNKELAQYLFVRVIVVFLPLVHSFHVSGEQEHTRKAPFNYHTGSRSTQQALLQPKP